MANKIKLIRDDGDEDRMDPVCLMNQWRERRHGDFPSRHKLSTASLSEAKGDSNLNGEKGCPSAVHDDGAPAEEYCLGNDNKFPWWSTCCTWKCNPDLGTESCLPKSGSGTIICKLCVSFL